MKFEELREKHKTFNYDSYKYDIKDNTINITFNYSIEDLDNFVTNWTIPCSRNVNIEILDKLIFSLGMVEAISYYKITCSKIVNINTGSLTDKQEKFFKKLFYKGLGEFMYKNNINVKEDELFSFNYKKEESNRLHDENTYNGILLPIGGGKDSCVSIELLKDKDITIFSINPNITIKNCIAVSNVNKNIEVKRVYDNKMLDFNSKGYLNGHTPFSAIVAFASYITALTNGIRYIALSNESSANESTIKDTFVNHQYSKSIEFENDFIEYTKDLSDADVHYFSFLRPLKELQIAYLFSKTNIYNKVFRSCNKGSKEGIWCCNCPKCLFVYIILSPFIKEDELINIFSKKVFDNKELENDFRGLIGYDENKPFECVGTRKEAVSALGEYIKENSSYLTDKYKDFIIKNAYDIKPMLKEIEENNVPEELLDIIKKAL